MQQRPLVHHHPQQHQEEHPRRLRQPQIVSVIPKYITEAMAMRYHDGGVTGRIVNSRELGNRLVIDISFQYLII